MDESGSFDHLLTMSQERLYIQAALHQSHQHQLPLTQNTPEKVEEIPISLLATTALAPMWCDFTLQLHPYSIKLTRPTISIEIFLALITSVILNPDNHEIRIETKESQGWFVIKCQHQYDYEVCVHFIQTKATEVFKQIIFEFKTIEQDKRYGLLDVGYKQKQNNQRMIIKKQFKQSFIHFKVMV